MLRTGKSAPLDRELPSENLVSASIHSLWRFLLVCWMEVRHFGCRALVFF